MTTDLGDFPLTGTNLIHDGVAVGYGPRTRILGIVGQSTHLYIRPAQFLTGGGKPSPEL
jgi:hypothetical protein